MKFYINTFTAFLLLMSLLACNKPMLELQNESTTALANVIIACDNGDYLLAGQSHKSAYHSRGYVDHGDGRLLRVHPKQGLLWEKSYPFFTNNPIFDIIETAEGHLITLSSVNNEYPYSEYEKQTYISCFDANGQLLWQETLAASVRKIVPDGAGGFIAAGLYAGVYEEAVPGFVHLPFVVGLDAAANELWRTEITTQANRIDEIRLNNGQIQLSLTAYSPTNNSRQIITLSQSGNLLEQPFPYISNNSLYLDEEDVLFAFNNTSTTANDWQLEIQRPLSQKLELVSLGDYASYELLPQTNLKYLQVCVQLYQHISDVQQVVKNDKGEYYIHALVTKNADPTTEKSRSTQAYCDGAIDGFLLLKLKKDLSVDWIKFVDQKVIPLDMSVTEKGTVLIAGTSFGQEKDQFWCFEFE